MEERIVTAGLAFLITYDTFNRQRRAPSTCFMTSYVGPVGHGHLQILSFRTTR